ncbi:MAG: hypothetical protein V3U79_03225 [Dehalococcoidia bacterium]
MTLRLAGEDYSVIAGLDGLGWLRDIKATSSDPALKVDQKGSGSILDLLDSGTPVLRALNGGNLAFLVGKAPTAGQYEIGRNADGTNRLQFNIPTGASFEFSINDVAKMVLSATAMAFGQGTTLSDGVSRLVLSESVGTQLEYETSEVKVASANIQFAVQGSTYATITSTELDLSTLYAELGEIADPAAPAANRGRLYMKDNGSGKTQLAVRFPTGAVQVIATEP